jgi:hypothetical protein
MVAVKLFSDPRWITTVTLPLPSATADKTVGAVFKPFCEPLMYSSPHPPASLKYPLLPSSARRVLTVAASGQAAQLSVFAHGYQWFATDGSATNNLRAACRAPATSTNTEGLAAARVGLETGVGLATGVGLETLVVAVDAPQSTKATTAATNSSERMDLAVSSIAITFGLTVVNRRSPCWWNTGATE